jgi:hypothetical protein
MNHLHGVNCNMTQLLIELQSSQPFLRKKRLVKQNLHKLNTNDYISQSVNIILYKHNIYSQYLDRSCQENICLLAQNMKFNILYNENEKILNYIMCDRALYPHEHNKICVSLLDLWFDCMCIEKDTSCGMG